MADIPEEVMAMLKDAYAKVLEEKPNLIDTFEQYVAKIQKHPDFKTWIESFNKPEPEPPKDTGTFDVAPVSGKKITTTTTTTRRTLAPANTPSMRTDTIPAGYVRGAGGRIFKPKESVVERSRLEAENRARADAARKYAWKQRQDAYYSQVGPQKSGRYDQLGGYYNSNTAFDKDGNEMRYIPDENGGQWVSTGLTRGDIAENERIAKLPADQRNGAVIKPRKARPGKRKNDAGEEEDVEDLGWDNIEYSDLLKGLEPNW